MFERFTERARRATILGQEEARTLGHHHYGTEHLLLGLLREEEGLAARVLGSLGVTAEEVRARVVGIVGTGDEIPRGKIEFTPRAEKVFDELALRGALSLGHNYIGTEHLLLGLICENEGIATSILLELGVDAGKIRSRIIDMLSGPGRRQRVRSYRTVIEASPPRWEYRVERWPRDQLSERQGSLDELGAQGWGLRTALSDGDHVQLVFERIAPQLG